MKAENKKFLEDNRHHWITLRDAQFCRHLDGNTREGMRRVMAEEFVPGYSADLWCPPCVAEMLTTLYRYFEDWEKQQVPVPTAIEPDAPVEPVVDLVNANVEPASIPADPEPVKVKASFPSNKQNKNKL